MVENKEKSLLKVILNVTGIGYNVWTRVPM